jgi:hypothetical protein
MKLGGACLVAAAMLVLSACGQSDTETPEASPSADAIEPGSQAAAQKVLDKAEASFAKSGTGAFELRMNLNRGVWISGVWDLRAPATDYTMTMHGVDDGRDVVVRTRIVDNTGFTQVSTLDDAMCWMKLDSADRESMGVERDISPVHPAALMLLEPHAVGLVKDSDVAGHQDVRAEMAFDEAVSAVLPKAFNKLSEPPPEDATVPVTVGIDAGRYASIRYSVADIIRASRKNGVDLFAGAEDVAERNADAKVEINYRSFGDKVDIAAPDPDLIVDVDMADLQASGGSAETCAAAR